jgi:hypothetical protein
MATKTSRKRKPAPTPNPLRTVDDLRQWMRSHVAADEHGRPWTRASLDAAVLWFHCVEEAESGAYSGLTTKDIASLLQTGLGPLTLDDAQEMLDELHAMDGEPDDNGFTPDCSSVAQEIEINLRIHFGLNKSVVV